MLMVEANPTINPATGRQWDLNSLMKRLLDLQDSLLQSQEKNLILSTQARELERLARDAADFKAELAAQGVLLTDKTRENKHLHQELSQVTSTLEVKLQEVEDLKAAVSDLQHQLKMRESERDLLAVMLNEAESAKRRFEEMNQRQIEESSKTKDNQFNSSWLLKCFKGKNSS